MAQERIIETRTRDGAMVSRHIIINEGNDRFERVWLVLVLLAGIVGALFAIDQLSDAEITKDAAITQAAQDVGAAANQVGDAAQDAVEKIG